MNFLFTNYLILYIGAYSRYFFYKFILKKKMSFNTILKGHNAKEKNDSIEVKAEFINRLVGFTIFIPLSILIAYFVYKKH